MIERINAFVAARFSGVGTTRGSFIRIHAWAIAFLLLASTVAASHAPSLAHRRGRGSVELVATDVNDPRGFLSSPFGKNYFHIAWIGGSEGDIYRVARSMQYIPREVLPLLPSEIDGRKIAIDLYYLPAMRVADEYFTLLEALADKPDMVVMSLNPVWTLNPIAVHQWNQLDGNAAAKLVGKPSGWPIAASILAPSDLAWGLAAKLKPVANRAYYSQEIHDVVDDLGPLDRSKLEKLTDLAAAKPDRETKLLTDGQLGFWFEHRFDEAPVNPYVQVNNHGMTPQRWAQWMDKSNQLDNTLNQHVLKAIGHELSTARLPSYVYVAQMNADWLATEPLIQRATAEVEQQFRRAGTDFDARTVRYQPKSVSRFTSGLHFLPGDPVHTDHTGTLAPYLAAQLCATLAQSGSHTRCGAIQKGNGNG